MSLFVRKDDTVMVVTGRERGKTGKVIKVLPGKSRLFIERVNLVKRHTKPRSAQQPGGIVEKEASIHVSNVMLMCDPCNAPVRVGYKFLEDGEKVRICRRCGQGLG
ncbi:MAG: 50S ribosomal protein L24 [Deltaproteobacteria bacterium]|nr:50S ribosomal protein L24 [Deltaproteobacteria bacterium]